MTAAASGGRPPLILAPGHLGDERIYAPQIQALGLGGAMLAEHRLDEDLGAMAERLLAAAPPRFAVMGLSMGGMLIFELMARAPERILGAALLATDACAARPKEIDWRAGIMAEVEREGAPALRRFATWFTQRFFTHSPAAQERLGPALLEMSAAVDPQIFLRQGAALSSRRDRLEALAAYAEGGRPLTLIAGAEDRVCPLVLHRMMKQAAPSAPLTVIEQCGHLITLEKPEIATAALRGWLADLETAGGA